MWLSLFIRTALQGGPACLSSPRRLPDLSSVRALARTSTRRWKSWPPPTTSRRPSAPRGLRPNPSVSHTRAGGPPLGDEPGRAEHGTGKADDGTDDRTGQHDIPAAGADTHVALEQLAYLTHGEASAVQDDQEDGGNGHPAA